MQLAKGMFKINGSVFPYTTMAREPSWAVAMMPSSLSFEPTAVGGPPSAAQLQRLPFVYSIRTMMIDDYDSVIGMMKQTPGVTFRDADSRESTAMYLDRNPELSFVAIAEKKLVGCIMSGHDGRRGYLQHLVVHSEFRRHGIANSLVERCLTALEKLGIRKSHIDVLKSNDTGAAYWESQGWKLRTDIHRYSFVQSGGNNV